MSPWYAAKRQNRSRLRAILVDDRLRPCQPGPLALQGLRIVRATLLAHRECDEATTVPSMFDRGPTTFWASRQSWIPLTSS
jgi:hypothetical protein